MIPQQKCLNTHNPSSFDSHNTFFHKIDQDCQQLKLLLNSYRARSVKDEVSRDSEWSGKTFIEGNNSQRQENCRRGKRRQLSCLYRMGQRQIEEGDRQLAARHRKKNHGPSQIELSRLTNQSRKHNLLAQSHQDISFSPVTPTSNSNLTSKPKQSTRSGSTFRITSKTSQKRKNPTSLHLQKHLNPQTDQFQVQSINAYLIVAHLYSIKGLSAYSDPEQIFTFFESIYQIAGFRIAKRPVIKRYKNCVYYGEKPGTGEGEVYKGMIWYYKGALYYGEMTGGKKNGLGIEIKTGKDATVWKGTFCQGHKQGYFSIESNSFKYYGLLKDGQYNGQGHLITAFSEYKGTFCQGLKQGQGMQKFTNKSQYKGQYFANKFDGQGELKAHHYYYQGLFKAGKPDGKGFERTQQYEYLGQFVMGVKEGKGRIKTNDGVTVTCLFHRGLAVDPNASKCQGQVLEPMLSKELKALNEESQEGTIESMFIS